nr:receptor-type tyrosine-protein phosphatase alpha-like isoform X3 [Penaeus vannamei]
MRRLSSLPYFLLFLFPAASQSEVPPNSTKLILDEIVSNRPKQHNLKVTLPTFGKEENGKTARVSWKSLFAKADYVLVWHDNEDIFDFQGASDLKVPSQPSKQYISTEVELEPNRIYWFQILHPNCSILTAASDPFPCAAAKVAAVPGGLHPFIATLISFIVISLAVSGSYFIYSVYKGSVKFEWNGTMQTASEATGKRILLVKLGEVVRRLMSDGEELLAVEFESLREQSPQEPVRVASLTPNKYKNRYSNILPFDKTRVLLERFPNDTYSDYVNASYVHSFTKKNRFIATQGPKKSTQQDFWRMIWEQNVYVIIMVTSCTEGMRVSVENKCSKYWPDVQEPPFCFPREDLIVCTTKESTKRSYVVRSIQIKKGDDQRNCLHYQYVDWPDMGCPDSPNDLVSFMMAVKPVIVLGDFHVVVHCSAGVGRTGTFIGLYNTMLEMDKGNSVDIYECVLRMRSCRMNMVQTQRQYAYLYRCALQYYEQIEAARKNSTYTIEDQHLRHDFPGTV